MSLSGNRHAIPAVTSRMNRRRTGKPVLQSSLHMHVIGGNFRVVLGEARRLTGFP
ncbi:hypothetical protein C7S14_1993 [Burkholderia cepacia]|nr:hypothetical protein [Burkholderia cepacia]QOH38715.1 hypothetical protein C7S14_1993 [Burkholderia cepacia]